MKEQQIGKRLIELGRSEEEVLVLARRMIEMGRLVAERFSTAHHDEVTEIVGATDGLRAREMVLALPGGRLMTLSMKLTFDEKPIEMSVTYHLPDGTLYEEIDFGTVTAAQLETEPAEAAAQLCFTTKRITDGGIWGVHLYQIKTAPVISARNPHAPWGIVH